MIINKEIIIKSSKRTDHPKSSKNTKHIQTSSPTTQNPEAYGPPSPLAALLPPAVAAAAWLEKAWHGGPEAAVALPH
jgi:hypothetical protein